MTKSPSQLQTEQNLNSWQKNDPRYKVCPKCKGWGTQVTKARREYSRCTQCSGSGWKFIG
jgi:DnaJ-class molecular chaperone